MIKNIQMNVKTATGYDSLLPVTTATNVSYVNTSSELVATSVQQAIDEVAVNVIEITLPSAGWIGTTAPYSQTIAVDGIIANSGLITLGFKPTTDAVMQYILSQSNIICSARAVNSLTFLAYGMRPNVAINIIASVSGGEAGIINALPGSGEIENVWQRVEVTTSQTWVVPAGVTEIDVTCVGGGGAGRAGGGGSGYIRRKRLQVIPASQHTITIGAAGQNADGGDTKFDEEVVAAGGRTQLNASEGGSGNAGGGGVSRSSDLLSLGGSSQEGGDGGNAFYGVYANKGCDSATAKGGNSFSDSYRGAGAGGGAGIDGGDGGNGGHAGDGGGSFATGGGAGGYGSQQIAPIASANTYWAQPGKGYGAGGAGTVGGVGNGIGAPGICVIKFLKAVTA